MDRELGEAVTLEQPVGNGEGQSPLSCLPIWINTVFIFLLKYIYD